MKQNYTNDKKIAIIILSFNDDRISRAIKSVINNDKKNLTKIYVIDAKSDEKTISIIKAYLREDDVLISEKDEGIFDGLNKGLDIINERYFGWLGSDDYYPRCDNFFDDLIDDFSKDNSDAVILDCHVVNAENKLLRVTKARDKNEILNGRNNGHFSTFIKSSSLNNIRFETKYSTFADILFFNKYFKQHNIKVTFDNRIGCFQEAGGVSNGSIKYIIYSNFKLLNVLIKKIGFLKALSFSYNKLIIKLNLSLFFIKPTILFIKRFFISPFPTIESFIRQFFIFKYKAPELEINYINNLPQNDELIALDVGAAEGYFSYNLSQKFRYVHAFEPHPDHLRLLKPFRYRNIICHNVALSDSNEKTVLNVPLTKNNEVKHEASLKVSNKTFYDFKEIIVDCKKLDDYFEELDIKDKIGFIKIDVEGFENEVIRGAKKIIERDMPIILCEIELRHNENCKGIFSYLSQIGYKSYITKNGKDLIPFHTDDLVHLQSKERLQYRLNNGKNYKGFEYINNFFFIRET